MTVLAIEDPIHLNIRSMPEFEDDPLSASQSESYTPSTDASKKPRTRRRSGGFKTEVADSSSANIGEVSAADALKKEKLSGGGKPSEEPKAQRSEPREPRQRREKEPRQKREPREPKEPRRETNPQPSPETLAAIANVEAQIAARRAEREKNKPAKAKTERKPQSNKGGKRPAPKNQKKKGLLASILSIFGLGPKEPIKKKGGNRGGNRGGRPQGNGGNRGGQNRGRGGKGGNRGGQGRKRGGQGGQQRNDRRNTDAF